MAITGWAGLWNNEFGETYPSVRNGKQVYKQLRLVMKGKRGRKLRELMTEVTGTAAGSAASATEKRVQAVRNTDGVDMGGVRPIQTRTLVGRNTEAADITLIDTSIARSPQPTYPVDLSGNGGGGKLGY